MNTVASCRKKKKITILSFIVGTVYTRMLSFSRVVCEWSSFGTNQLLSFFSVKW